jgi:hypothetical protein
MGTAEDLWLVYYRKELNSIKLRLADNTCHNRTLPEKICNWKITVRLRPITEGNKDHYKTNTYLLGTKL